MKTTLWITLGTLILMGASGASAQSLGDYAKAARKNKPQPNSESRYFDNDNLPTTEQLSVVGPEPSAPAAAATGTSPAATTDPKAAEADRKRAADELQKKIDQQKEKLAGLSHELNLDQREYRLRAASYYADAGNALRNGAQWNKDDADYKADMEAKQKAIDDVQAELSKLQEQAQKAGINPEKNKDADKANDTDKDKDKDKN